MHQPPPAWLASWRRIVLIIKNVFKVFIRQAVCFINLSLMPRDVLQALPPQVSSARGTAIHEADLHSAFNAWPSGSGTKPSTSGSLMDQTHTLRDCDLCHHHLLQRSQLQHHLQQRRHVQPRPKRKPKPHGDPLPTRQQPLRLNGHPSTTWSSTWTTWRKRSRWKSCRSWSKRVPYAHSKWALTTGCGRLGPTTQATRRIVRGWSCRQIRSDGTDSSSWEWSRTRTARSTTSSGTRWIHDLETSWNQEPPRGWEVSGNSLPTSFCQKSISHKESHQRLQDLHPALIYGSSLQVKPCPRSSPLSMTWMSSNHMTWFIDRTSWKRKCKTTFSRPWDGFVLSLLWWDWTAVTTTCSTRTWTTPTEKICGASFNKVTPHWGRWQHQWQKNSWRTTDTFWSKTRSDQECGRPQRWNGWNNFLEYGW